MRTQYGLIIVWVVVVSSIFVVAFAFRFGGWPTSNDVSDWADFATYLSGTVGVTAIVGTLFAVVRTLGQQKALIKSQDELLNNQVEQLNALKEKNKEDAEVIKIELAHKYAMNIFPIMFEDARNDMERNITFEADGPYLDALNKLRSKDFNPEDYKVGDFFKGGAVLLLSMAEMRKNETDVLIKRIIGNPLYLINFSAMQVVVDKDLFYYFESAMGDYWRVLECCYAYYEGLNEKPHNINSFALLRLKRKPRNIELYARNWYELGCLYKEGA